MRASCVLTASRGLDRVPLDVCEVEMVSSSLDSSSVFAIIGPPNGAEHPRLSVLSSRTVSINLEKAHDKRRPRKAGDLSKTFLLPLGRGSLSAPKCRSTGRHLVPSAPWPRRRGRFVVRYPFLPRCIQIREIGDRLPRSLYKPPWTVQSRSKEHVVDDQLQTAAMMSTRPTQALDSWTALTTSSIFSNALLLSRSRCCWWWFLGEKSWDKPTDGLLCRSKSHRLASVKRETSWNPVTNEMSIPSGLRI